MRRKMIPSIILWQHAIDAVGICVCKFVCLSVRVCLYMHPCIALCVCFSVSSCVHMHTLMLLFLYRYARLFLNVFTGKARLVINYYILCFDSCLFLSWLTESIFKIFSLNYVWLICSITVSQWDQLCFINEDVLYRTIPAAAGLT